MSTERRDPIDSPLWLRLGWLALIWAGSVSALGAIAFLIRIWLKP